MQPISQSVDFSACRCYNPAATGQFSTDFLGADTHHHGEVYLKTCIDCKSIWLEYFYENEAFSHSGRWYRGLITQDQAQKLLPAEAIGFLEGLDWYICGGSYFINGPYIIKGKLNL